jgi:hypothetical protein
VLRSHRKFGLSRFPSTGAFLFARRKHPATISVLLRGCRRIYPQSSPLAILFAFSPEPRGRSIGNPSPAFNLPRPCRPAHAQPSAFASYILTT